MVRILPQYSRNFEPLAREMWANAQLITTHDRDTPAMSDFDDLSEDERQRVLMMAEVPYRRYVAEPRERRRDLAFWLVMTLVGLTLITLAILDVRGML